MAATPSGRKAGRCLLQLDRSDAEGHPPFPAWLLAKPLPQHELSPLPNSHLELLGLWLIWCSFWGWDPPCACLVGGTWILSNLKEPSDISAFWRGEADVQACPLVPVVRAAWGNQPCCNRQNQLKLKLLLQFASAQVKNIDRSCWCKDKLTRGKKWSGDQ